MTAAVAGKLKRIMIATAGSRGDMQPYIALALELQKAGYSVCIAGHKDFEGFVQGEFGIKFYGCLCNVHAEITGNARLFASMCKGNTVTFIKGVGDVHKSHADSHMELIVKAVDDFAPDLVICGTLMEFVFNWAMYLERIPAISLQPSGLVVLSPGKRNTGGFPNLHSRHLNSWLHSQLLWGSQYDFMLAYDRPLQRLKGYRIRDVVSKADFFSDLRHPPFPMLIAQNELFYELTYGPKSQMPENTKFIGGLVVPMKAMKADGPQGGEELAFGGSAEMKRLKDFLASGAPPAYMGWGSMICHSPENMLLLVLQALKLSGLRAVIVGGWAKLRLELLDQRKHPELYEYAAQNAIFVTAAPHEWLFPQCSMVVHHGGTGTLQAGFRAAVPTVITPVFLDQFDAAFIVNKLGVGLGLRQLQQLRPQELGEALKTVNADTTMAERAREVSEQLKADNGASKAVEEVEDFWKQFVETGRVAHFVEARRSRPRRFALLSCQAPEASSPSRSFLLLFGLPALLLSAVASAAILLRAQRIAAPVRSCSAAQ